MKRIFLIMAGVAALAGMAFGPSLAQAGNSYPPGGSLTATPHSNSPGDTVTFNITGFCNPVNIVVTGPSPSSAVVLTRTGVNPSGQTMAAPNTLGTYTVTVTGLLEPCTTVAVNAAVARVPATASDTFIVVAAQTTTTTAPTTTTTTTAPATSTTVASGGPVTTTTVAATTTTAVGSGGPVTTTTTPLTVPPTSKPLPVTGSNSSSTLQIALALAAGGAMLLIVARVRRQQHTA